MVTLLAGNYVTSLKRGRDAQRKADISNIQKALELYYEDQRRYPNAAEMVWGNQLADPGGTGKIYMRSLPRAPGSNTYNYYINGNNQGYGIYTCLETTDQVLPYNSTPAQWGTGGWTCPVQCQYPAGTNVTCVFGISSSNIAP